MLSPEGVEKAIRERRSAIGRRLREIQEEAGRASSVDLDHEEGLGRLMDLVTEIHETALSALWNANAMETLIEVRDAR